MMDHTEVTHFVGMLVVILALAKLAGAVAQRLGQPAVLGELIGGVLAGPSVLGWVDPDHQAIHLLAELGVLILLFAIGLETDLSRLLRVGATSMTVAVVGVVLPFVLGYVACRCIGLSDMRSIMAAATLTATSVGITARVLSDLGHLRTQEGQIILGAALIDDVLGLLLLTIVEGLSRGPGGLRRRWSSPRPGGPSASSSSPPSAGTLGRPGRSPGCRARIELPATLTVLAVVLALGMAWLADRCGSAMIIGAFAAGLILSRLPRAHEIERGITALGHFFVPIFFVSVGASVDIGALNPLDPASQRRPAHRRRPDRGRDRRQAPGRLRAVLVPREQGGRRRGHDPARRGRADLRADRPGVPGLRRGSVRRDDADGHGHDPRGPARA